MEIRDYLDKDNESNKELYSLKNVELAYEVKFGESLSADQRESMKEFLAAREENRRDDRQEKGISEDDLKWLGGMHDMRLAISNHKTYEAINNNQELKYPKSIDEMEKGFERRAKREPNEGERLKISESIQLEYRAIKDLKRRGVEDLIKTVIKDRDAMNDYFKKEIAPNTITLIGDKDITKIEYPFTFEEKADPWKNIRMLFRAPRKELNQVFKDLNLDLEIPANAQQRKEALADLGNIDDYLVGTSTFPSKGEILKKVLKALNDERRKPSVLESDKVEIAVPKMDHKKAEELKRLKDNFHESCEENQLDVHKIKQDYRGDIDAYIKEYHEDIGLDMQRNLNSTLPIDDVQAFADHYKQSADLYVEISSVYDVARHDYTFTYVNNDLSDWNVYLEGLDSIPEQYISKKEKNAIKSEGNALRGIMELLVTKEYTTVEGATTEIQLNLLDDAREILDSIKSGGASLADYGI
jgi:hypothetical protein